MTICDPTNSICVKYFNHILSNALVLHTYFFTTYTYIICDIYRLPTDIQYVFYLVVNSRGNKWHVAMHTHVIFNDAFFAC